MSANFTDATTVLKALYRVDELIDAAAHRKPHWGSWLRWSYSPEFTWVDGLVAVLIADRVAQNNSHCITDTYEEAEHCIWLALRGKVDWEEALHWAPNAAYLQEVES